MISLVLSLFFIVIFAGIVCLMVLINLISLFFLKLWDIEVETKGGVSRAIGLPLLYALATGVIAFLYYFSLSVRSLHPYALESFSYSNFNFLKTNGDLIFFTVVFFAVVVLAVIFLFRFIKLRRQGEKLQKEYEPLIQKGLNIKLSQNSSEEEITAKKAANILYRRFENFSLRLGLRSVVCVVIAVIFSLVLFSMITTPAGFGLLNPEKSNISRTFYGFHKGSLFFKTEGYPYKNRTYFLKGKEILEKHPEVMNYLYLISKNKSLEEIKQKQNAKVALSQEELQKVFPLEDIYVVKVTDVIFPQKTNKVDNRLKNKTKNIPQQTEKTYVLRINHVVPLGASKFGDFDLTVKLSEKNIRALYQGLTPYEEISLGFGDSRLFALFLAFFMVYTVAMFWHYKQRKKELETINNGLENYADYLQNIGLYDGAIEVEVVEARNQTLDIQNTPAYLLSQLVEQVEQEKKEKEN